MEILAQFKTCTRAKMKAVFPTLWGTSSVIKMRKLLRVLRFMVEWTQTHYTKYDFLNMVYVAVLPQVYGFSAAAKTTQTHHQDPVTCQTTRAQISLQQEKL